MATQTNPNTDRTDFLRLGGSVCVVTGAGSGIGRAIAISFAQQGGVVAVLDRDTAGCDATVAAIDATGGKALTITCDVSDPESVANAAQASAAAFGPCDVLVNCAGMLRAGPLDVLTFADWNQGIAVNLSGAFLCSQTFGSQMRSKGKGSIVHVASIAAIQPTPNAGPYSVTKAGISMLSRQIAIEWGAHGIRSNSVSPGMIPTPMTKAAYEKPGMTEARIKAVPAGRLGTPQDIADAVVFLASDRSAYISGEDLTVDGGFTRNLMGMMPKTAGG